MNVAILSLVLLYALIHHCDCLPRTDNDVTIEDKVASLLRRLTKTNNDEHRLKKDMGTDQHIPIPTDKRTAINRQGDDACSGTPVEYTATSGTIQSPGYATSTYQDNSDCQWRITASSGYVISATFQQLSVEPAIDCRFDSVTLYDGSSASSPELGKYCTGDPGTITSTGSSLFIRFTSDYSVHSGLFSMSWSFVSQGGQADNVALNKPASQVSTYGQHVAGWAVDGRQDTVSCTYINDVHPWWAVDLGAAYDVRRVTVTNDANIHFGFRLDNFVVGLTNDNPATTAPVYKSSYTLCAQYSGSLAPSETGTVVCAPSSQNARFVIVQGSLTRAEAICLTEVAVFVSDQTPRPSCGSPAVEPDFSQMRIVGGVEARKYSWPWQCSVAPNYNQLPWCGATVIDEYHILTAAHCVVNDDGVQAPGDSVRVACGRHNWQDSSEEHSTQQRFDGGVTVIVHEKYGDAFYDVAIIRLPRPLTFNDYVQPICLPSSPVAVGTNCVATGWGETRGTGDSNVLRQVYLPVISWSDCYDAYSPRYGSWVKEYMICAGPMVSSKSVCFGDSGGPLVCKQGDRWFQYGVSSFLYDNDCHVPKPSGFADVVYYLPWIQQHTGTGASARMNSEHTSTPPTPPPVKKHPLEGNVSKPPHPLDLIKKERRNKDRSKPAEDPYEVEKELLDLLQRKFADD